jgi:hypothetical protein
MNSITSNPVATIPLPADATRADDWAKVFSLDELHRFFFGTRRDTDRACVGIVGFQNPDGTIRQRCIQVGAGRDTLDVELDAAAARELARALIAAAERTRSVVGP